jgi:type I restriction enzyme S subunit
MSQFIEMFGNPLSSIQKNELKKLGDCCQINPRRPSVSISDSDLVSFVPMPAVNEDGYIDGATNEEYGKVKKGFTYFENNDVLFAKITPCMENGKGAIAEALTNGIGMGSTEFHVLRPIDGISNPYWLLTLTRMPIFREYAAKNMSGTGGQRRVGAAFLENFMIGLPSISEQETFETIYRQADKSEFVGCKSQFIEMFKGDNQVPLGDICNIEKGATITRNDVLHGEVPVVAGGQEPSCYHNVANREAGAITVSASGAYAGYINFWNCPIFASDCNTIISKDDEKTDQTFVYFGLRAMQKQIYGLQKGGAQPHVYGKDLQKFMFPCPSYAKQIEFSKMAKQADKSEYYN